jgi:hypothetical protein
MPKEIEPKILLEKLKLAKKMFESRNIEPKREPLGSIITCNNASGTMQLVIDAIDHIKSDKSKRFPWAVLYFGFAMRSMIGLGLWGPEELSLLKLEESK